METLQIALGLFVLACGIYQIISSAAGHGQDVREAGVALGTGFGMLGLMLLATTMTGPVALALVIALGAFAVAAFVAAMVIRRRHGRPATIFGRVTPSN